MEGTSTGIGKRILVTGTSGGIGSAVRNEAVTRGWTVVELNRGGFDGSLGDEPFDAVVFATGMCPVKPLTLLTDAEFSETLDVNCGLFVKVMRRLVREKLNSPSGMMAIAVSSVSAVEGWAGGAAYCASKGGLSAVCRALNVELKPRGISVTALEPRYIRTRMFENGAGRMGVDPKLAKDPADFAREIMEMLS